MNMNDCDNETSEITEDKNALLREFINMYETLPELWDSSNPNYMIKNRRNIALERLLLIYKKIQPNATVDDVRKKINTLRSNYRKEVKKIINPKRSGSGLEDVYEPSSWIYNELEFLSKTEVPVPLLSPISPQEPFAVSHDLEELVEIVHTEMIDTEIQNTPAISLSSVNQMPEMPRKKRKKQSYLAKQNELLSLACNYLSQSNDLEKYNNNGSENFELAVVWTKKLDSLQPQQKMYAEKAINDILFEAQLGTLHRNSVKIN